MKIGIVGIGLIGGSIAKDLNNRGHEIVGFDNNPVHCAQAIDLNIVDRILPIDVLAEECEVVFISIPVHATVKMIPTILNNISWSSVVIDTCSTKGSICAMVKDHPKRGRYVASHPLAGTEFSGPQAALEGLFRHKKNIICEEHLSDVDAMNTAIALFESIDLKTLFMDPVEHDRHMAYVSHLSHVSAFMLGTTVLEIEKDQKQIFNLASTGFESTVRLAKSSPQTWTSIFDDNSKNVVKALESYIHHLEQFKKVIEDKDVEAMSGMIEKANDIRRVLNGMKYNAIKLS